MATAARSLEVLIKGSLFRVRAAQAHASPNERAVVLVHGFGGDAQDTWKAPGADASFPELLADDPTLADHDFFVFQYVTKDLRPPAIDNIVVQLKFVLKEYLRDSRVIFVAHSMGGLVCMRCVLSLLEEGQSQVVAGLLLYGTPMTGVEWARYAQLSLRLGGFIVPHLRWLNSFVMGNKQVTALAEGSEFIDRLTGAWVLRVLNGGHPKIPAGHRAWFPVRVVTGNDDWVVKESSARAYYSEIDWIDVNDDHRLLVKPRDRSEFTYQVARNFLADCRAWMNPRSLLKLRRHLDEVWHLHECKRIADWQFELSFDADVLADDPGPFGVPGFRAFRVLRCSYRRQIERDYVKVGFAIGNIAAGAVWSDEFAFLHSVHFGAVPAAATETIRDRLRALLHGPEGWARVFDDVAVRITPDGKTWHAVDAGPLEQVNDGLVRRFQLPPHAADLVGREAIIDVAFRSIIPAAITDYTMDFPWLCDGFAVRVAIKGNPSYLVANQAMRGHAAPAPIREHQGKVEYSSEELVLPGSSIQFEWAFDERATP